MSAYNLHSLGAVVLLGVLPTLLGCPKKNDQEKDPTLPLLQHLTLDGTARENGRVLLFSVDFRDEDGNLAAGKYVPLINDTPSGAEPALIKALFLKSNVPLTAATGRLEFELEVKIKDDDRPPEGSTFAVGLQVWDGLGNESNIPTVTVGINY